MKVKNAKLFHMTSSKKISIENVSKELSTHFIYTEIIMGKIYVITGLSVRFQGAGYLLLVAGEVASSHGAPPPPPQEVFEVQLLPFLKRHYHPKKAMFIMSTAIISGFMMIASLLKKITTF